MRRRSFLARCAALVAGLFCAGRTPAVTPLPTAADAKRFIRDRRAKASVVVVTRFLGVKAKARVGGNAEVSWIDDEPRWVSDGEPCWLVEANGQPLREGWLYIATLSPGGPHLGLPVYVCSAPVESA